MKISFENLKHLKLKDIMYPGATLLFILVIAFIFWKTISFVTAAINSSFTIDNQAVEQGKLKIDLATYYRVARKLNITTPTPIPSGQESEEIPTEEPSPSPSETPPPVAKSAVAVSIMNSTKTSGLAGELKTKIVQAGYTVASTGNQANVEPVTLIKASSDIPEEILNEIQTLVAQKYTEAKRETLPTSATLRIDIVIGTK